MSDGASTAGGKGLSASRYDAFISYSHAFDGKLAPVLQVEIERFAKPWHRPRARRIFRDQANLAANPHLWGAIEQALASSRWFVLLASPSAAQSTWVDREVEWWLRHRGDDRLLVVLTGGRSPWDPAEPGPHIADALPPSLVQSARGEPRLVDLRWLRDADQIDASNPRFRDCIADVAAAVSEVEKDSLVGEHVRQGRRTRRLVRGVVSGLSALLIAALVSGYVALDQRNAAQSQAAIATRQAQVATARLLAATSQTLLSTRLDQAQLLAVKAYAMDRDPETRSALFKATTASPQLVRFAALGSTATSLATAGAAPVAVVGTDDGRVLLWDLRTGSRSDVGRLKGSIADVSISDNGQIVVAADASQAVLWTSKGVAEHIPLPPGARPLKVAVSPTGARGAASASIGDTTRIIAVLDRRSHATAQATGVEDCCSGSQPALGPLLAFQDDSTLTSFSEMGFWQLRDGRTLRVRRHAFVGFGVHNYANALSRNGRYVGYGQQGGGSLFWDTRDAPPDPMKPDLEGTSGGGVPEALAISPDGRRIAIADVGSVDVSDAVPGQSLGPDAPSTVPHPSVVMHLEGNSRINPYGIAFGQDDDHLVTISDDRLALWDLSRDGRIVESVRTTITTGGNGNPAPIVAANSDARAVAVESMGDLTLLDLHGTLPREKELPVPLPQGTSFGAPAWDGSGTKVFVPTSDGRGRTYSILGEDIEGPWPAAHDKGEVMATAARAGRLVLVDLAGDLTIRSTPQGNVMSAVPAPARFSSNELGLSDVVPAADGAVAFVDPDEYVFVRASPEGQLRQLPGKVAGNGYHMVLSIGGRLLVNRPDHSIEVWSEDGSRLERRIAGEESEVTESAASPTGSLLAQQHYDGTVVLRDLNTSLVLGTVTTPARLPGSKTGLSFSGDGTKLVAATEGESSGRVRIWNLDESAWVRAACQAAGRNLTEAEWKRFAGSLDAGDLICRAGTITSTDLSSAVTGSFRSPQTSALAVLLASTAAGRGSSRLSRSRGASGQPPDSAAAAARGPAGTTSSR